VGQADQMCYFGVAYLSHVDTPGGVTILHCIFSQDYFSTSFF